MFENLLDNKIYGISYRTVINGILLLGGNISLDFLVKCVNRVFVKIIFKSYITYFFYYFFLYKNM